MEVKIQMGWAIYSGVKQYIWNSDIKVRYWRRIQSQWTKTEALSKQGGRNGRAPAGYQERSLNQKNIAEKKAQGE